MRPVGSSVGLYYDSPRRIAVGDYLQTPTKRTYLLTSIREQMRGHHAGVRKHLRAIVVDAADVPKGAVVHPLTWYARGKR